VGKVGSVIVSGLGADPEAGGAEFGDEFLGCVLGASKGCGEVEAVEAGLVAGPVDVLLSAPAALWDWNRERVVESAR